MRPSPVSALRATALLRSAAQRQTGLVPGFAPHTLNTVQGSQTGLYARILNGRYNVLERQRLAQAEFNAGVPVYLIGNGKYYFRVQMFVFGVSLALSGNAMYAALQV